MTLSRHHDHRRHRCATIAAPVLALIALAACGGSDGGADADSDDVVSTLDLDDGSTPVSGTVETEPVAEQDSNGDGAAGGVATLAAGDLSFVVEGLRCVVEDNESVTGISIMAVDPVPVSFSYRFLFIDGTATETLTMSGSDGSNAFIEHRQVAAREVLNTQTQAPGNFLQSPFEEITSTEQLSFDFDANTFVTIRLPDGDFEDVAGLVEVDCP